MMPPSCGPSPRSGVKEHILHNIVKAPGKGIRGLNLQQNNGGLFWVVPQRAQASRDVGLLSVHQRQKSILCYVILFLRERKKVRKRF